MSRPGLTVGQQMRIAGIASVLLLVVPIACLVLWDRGQREYRRGLRERDLPVTVRQAQPLIKSLERYTREKGHPPASLEELLPSYLTELPDPGPVAKNGWRYERDAEAGGWRLVVWVKDEYSPNTFMGFGDAFAYHPNGTYPKYAYGGVLIPFGKWGYYVE